MQERSLTAPEIAQAVIKIEGGNKEASRSPDLKALIEQRIKEALLKRQQAQREKQQLEVGLEAPVNTPASGINGARRSPDLGPNDELASDVEDASKQSGQHEDSTGDKAHKIVETAVAHPSMTPQETAWWAMSFEELYQHARSKNFGKTGTEGRKSGRIRIVKWLCEKEGIVPYVAPSITPVVEATPVIAQPTLLPSGAISHPEAILRTSDPALQRLIDGAEKKYRQWPAADLVALAMQRSYQLLKDSKGKLPSKSISAIANWLAAWDVLKSPREKKWWLGDGIDLINRAKAMGYQGASRKYEVIVWLRSTAEASEVGVTEIAEPTPNKRPEKRKAEEASQHISKRPAKGSKRPHGWHAQNFF